MTHQQEWSNAKNILCVRLDSLGDVLMMTPAIRALKGQPDGRRITLLTSRSGAEIASLIPEVDETMTYDPPWMKASAPPTDSALEFEMIDRLRKHKFDGAVIFTTFSQSPLPAALLTFLAEIPLRLAHCRENPYYLLTDWIPEADDFNQPTIRHEVRRQLDLVASIGSKTANERLSLQVPIPTLAAVRENLERIGLTENKPWAVLHPGATAASRRYPAENFASVAETLISKHGFQIIFTGSKTEFELVESIQDCVNTDTFCLAGQLGIGDLAALLSIAPLLITNNTGPAHIAAAVGTPVVVLYALTNPQHTPWQVPHRALFHDVPCKFCYKSICPMEHHNCLRLVHPADVVEAALELLATQKRHEAVR